MFGNPIHKRNYTSEALQNYTQETEVGNLYENLKM